MNNRLVIIGAGGHSKVIADIAVKNGYTDICFVDDTKADGFMDFPVIGKIDDIKNLNDSKTDFVIGIGNNKIREKIAEEYDVNYVSLVHPSTQLGLGVTIEKGTVVMAQAVINSDATVGKHCIINSGAVVEHDNVIEDYVHLSPKTALGGTVRIGKFSHIGIGASVIHNIYVCPNCKIGAGAVVVENIEKSGTYVGVPAKELL